MNLDGPIILIEDDLDDQELLKDTFKEIDLPNELIFFEDGEEALNFLLDTDIRPFLIFSDINMPKLNGLQLKEKLHNNEEFRLKAIPYIYFTTSAEQHHVVDAYAKSIQGIFIKPSSYTDIKRIIANIIEYWKECVTPNCV